MNTFGNSFRITIFGESHGPCVGCVIDGLPAGFSPDSDLIKSELSRRAARYSGSTERHEADDFEILSGLHKDKTCGTPLTVVFRNCEQRSSDYVSNAARPSHADLTAFVKYSGYNDPRGGGAFSGRLTLPLVFCGAIAKQLLAERGIKIISHVYSIGSIKDDAFDRAGFERYDLDPAFPVINTDAKRRIKDLFEELKENGDSIGGIAECMIAGFPIGIGEPFFDSIESRISHLLFSVPGVHGVEFGTGFKLSSMLGSEANDAILPGMRTATNHSGGINGGISNGMPVVFRAVFRPVPSIGVEQKTIDMLTGEPIDLKIKGRHDVCILPRGLAAVEAAASIAILDLLI